MRIKLMSCLSVAVLALTPIPAQAAMVFTGILSSANEVPANPSTGSGLATVTINDAMNLITIEAFFSGLTGTTTAAHIHCCTGAPGFNSGIAIETPSLPGFPLGVTSGTFSNSFDLLIADNYNPPFVAANGGTAAGARDALVAGLLGRNAYFNLHTSFRPGGELRGDLALVPEPSAWLMMIAGFGLIGAALRRPTPARAALALRRTAPV